MASVPQFEVETLKRVYDNKTGDYVEIGPDSDGLGLVSLRQFESGKLVAMITMSRAQAEVFVTAQMEFLTTKVNA